MADKQTKLSIVIRAVDNATAKIKSINDRLEAVTKPFRDFKEQLSKLRETSGLDDVIGGFKGVGSAIAGILSKVAMVGGVVGVAVAGLLHLVDGFDELGDKAEHIGVSVDFLAQMRYAAERTGASVESLDSGLQGFSTSLGKARAGTGRMAAFLTKVSPALLKQLKAAKSNEQAFDLLAGAMVKLEDPAKRAALAQATLGSAELGALFSKGPNGIKELRDRYFELAGSQEGAAKAAGETDDAMKDFKAATDGVKAALVQGLAPALTVIVKQLRDWFKENRERIAEWAKSLGEKLPGAVAKLVDVFKGIVNFIRPFVDSGTKLKILAGVLAAVIAGPLVASVYSLGVALLTTPVGWIVAGLAAIAAAALILITDWGGVRTFFVDLWDTLGEKFGIARDIVAFTLAPFIYIPAKIIANWDSISSFFVNLWDGITGVFEKAWNFIKGIIDKVVGAVDTVKGAVSDVIDFVNPFSSDDDYKGVTPVSDVTNKIIADLQAKQQAAAARVSVDFANAPRGTRVSTDPKSTADIDLSVGYQMGGL